MPASGSRSPATDGTSIGYDHVMPPDWFPADQDPAPERLVAAKDPLLPPAAALNVSIIGSAETGAIAIKVEVFTSLTIGNVEAAHSFDPAVHASGVAVSCRRDAQSPPASARRPA